MSWNHVYNYISKCLTDVEKIKIIIGSISKNSTTRQVKSQINTTRKNQHTHAETGIFHKDQICICSHFYIHIHHHHCSSFSMLLGSATCKIFIFQINSLCWFFSIYMDSNKWSNFSIWDAMLKDEVEVFILCWFVKTTSSIIILESSQNSSMSSVPSTLDRDAKVIAMTKSDLWQKDNL